MHRSNLYYGHDAILSWYCGLRYPRALSGVLQHGWVPDGAVLRQTPAISPRFRRFVWGERVAVQARQAGLDRVSVVGAPFAYLAHMLEQIEPVAAGARRTVVYPFHGLARRRQVVNHAQFLEEIKAVEPDHSDEVVIVLHRQEYEDDDVRATYQRANLKVVCNWSTGGRRPPGDPLFLVRQFNLLAGARRVVTNRMSTAVLYAGYLRKCIAIYGPQPDGFGTTEEFDFLVESYPDLFSSPGIPGHEARTLAEQEICPDILPPSHLISRLRVTFPRSVPASLARVAGSAKVRVRSGPV